MSSKENTKCTVDIFIKERERIIQKCQWIFIKQQSEIHQGTRFKCSEEKMKMDGMLTTVRLISKIQNTYIVKKDFVVKKQLWDKFGCCCS